MNIDDLKRSEDLKAMNTALESQREQLVALNNSKDEFISLASHQLRTPATGVKQYVGMLIEGFCGKLTSRQLAFLRIAFESNERQLRIIDNLLKVAHVDAGKVILTKEPVDLKTLIDDVIEEQVSTFKRRHQKVAFTPPNGDYVVSVDGSRLRMVIENLLDNASKYSPHNTTVTIQLAKNEAHTAITIADQGVGIAQKDKSRLFQKFSRIDNALSTLVGGTGIGLYWAKKIIDLHNGTISVASRVGKGSTFTITLPK